ncbi:hypothetical protein PybrP1_008409, partial [[Pythium] brassicae (nom. inval.)]
SIWRPRTDKTLPSRAFWLGGLTLHCWRCSAVEALAASFDQYVTVMVLDEASQIFAPMFYILSTSKSSDANWNMQHFVVQATDQRLALAQGVTDFEPALIGAVQVQFTEADVVSCMFHFKQAVFRAMRRLHILSSESRLVMARGCLDMLTVIRVNKICQHGIRWVDGGIQAVWNVHGISTD